MRRILLEKFRLKTSEKRNPLFLGVFPGFEPEPTRARARGFTKSAIMPAHNLTDPKRVVRTSLLMRSFGWHIYPYPSYPPESTVLSKESGVGRRKKENGELDWKLVLGQVVFGWFCGI